MRFLDELKNSRTKKMQLSWDLKRKKWGVQFFNTPTACMVNLSLNQSTFLNAIRSAVAFPIFLKKGLQFVIVS